MKKVLISALLMPAMVAIFFAACGGPSSPAEIEMSIWKQVKAGNYEKAVTIWFDNSVKAEEPDKEELKAGIKEFSGKMEASIKKKGGGIKDVKMLEETISEDGNSAKVICEITYNDGSIDKQTGKYVKVDGVWKIDPKMK